MDKDNAHYVCYVCNQTDKEEDMYYCAVCDRVICQSCEYKCEKCDNTICEDCRADCEVDCESCGSGSGGNCGECDFCGVCRFCESKIQYDLNMELFSACLEGNKVKVLNLLSRGADVDAEINKGWYCLGAAVLKGDLGIVKLLLQYGADPDIFGCDGKSAYVVASIKNRWDICYELAAHGADVVKAVDSVEYKYF